MCVGSATTQPTRRRGVGGLTHRSAAARLRLAASSSACACIFFKWAMKALLARKSPHGSVDWRDGAAYAYFLPAARTGR